MLFGRAIINLHGYVYPLLGEDGNYIVNDVQEEAINDVISFFKTHFSEK